MDRETLKTQLRQHEGVRNRPYRDTVGKVTIGVGRNLDDKGLKPKEIEFLLENDIDDVMTDIARTLPWFDGLSSRRQLVVADMVFNLGITRFLDFKRTIAAMAQGKYDLAADGMLESKWARQVGQRAKTLAGMMRAG
jgi:lysozyme